MSGPQYRLLDTFERTFRGVTYRHRASTQGDVIALQLYEDLFELGRSSKLKERIASQDYVVNIQNTRQGIKARRGDGTFGEKIPGLTSVLEPGFSVARGPLATVEIGIEVKILAKAMIKQIDRVISNLRDQVRHFHKGGDKPIAVGIVGVNHSTQYTSFEGDRSFPTDGRKYKHPIQEAAVAEERLIQEAKPHFNEFLILQFRATNEGPFPYEWVDTQKILADYGAILTRVSREYDRRF